MNTSLEGNNYQLDELPRDIKRMLKIQFKEFIYLIEDGELYEAMNSSDKSAANRLSVNCFCLRPRRIVA